jgi:hypothetical protein
MELTRRRFLECATGALAMAALPRASRPLGRRRSPGDRGVECALLDLEEECCIAESIAGYESALAQLGVSTARTVAPSAPRCAMLIVPAFWRTSPAAGVIIRRSLDDGATVILEAGAVFADADGADFRAHRDSLREELRLDVAAPLSLWPRRASADGSPYVDYSWPVAVRVRDFSRVVPVTSHQPRDTIIARVRDVPVALMRRVGSGTLIFLGSPLGPALHSGDAEARQWLADVSRMTGAISSA